MLDEKRAHLNEDAVLLLNKGKRGLFRLVFGRTTVIILLLALAGGAAVCRVLEIETAPLSTARPRCWAWL